MGAAAYATAVLADSPLAYWKLQEASGLPQDSSGNGLHATSTDGSPAYHQAGATAMGDFGIFYNGSAAGLVQRHRYDTAAIDDCVGDIAFECWYKINFNNANQPFIVINSNGTGASVFGSSSGHFAAFNNGVGSSANAAVLTFGTWYHIVVTRESGVWKYYVNGSLDTANAGSQTSTGTGGVTFWGGVNDNQCYLAHVAYYTHALTATDVSDHYSAATGAVTTFVPQTIIIS